MQYDPNIPDDDDYDPEDIGLPDEADDWEEPEPDNSLDLRAFSTVDGREVF